MDVSRGTAVAWIRSELEWIQETILTAHTAKASGLLESAYHAFSSLGERFVLNDLHASAQSYYQECLELAKKHGWVEGQLNANFNIGWSSSL